MKPAASTLVHLASAGLVAFVVGGTTSAAAGPAYLPPVQVGTLSADAITEASGLAAGRVNPTALWTHNDSGDTNRIFAVSTSGSLLRQYNLTGALASDYEDIAIGPGPVEGVSYLYVGDIGDNSSIKPSVAVYRVPEPQATLGTPLDLGGVEKITLVYPDGPRDAESLMIDPLTRDLLVVTKSDAGLARFYRAPFPQATAANVTLEFLPSFTGLRATGGDISADGNHLIVRGASQAFQWTRPAGGTLADALALAPDVIALAPENRGESIAFSAPGTTPGFYTVSEGVSQPIYFYAAVPEPATSALTLLCGVRLLARRRARM